MGQRSSQDRLVDALRYTHSELGLDMLARAISAGADVNAFDDRLDGTPLRYAIANPRALRVLLDAGADPEEARLHPWDRYRPLYLAVQRERQAAIDMLLEYGADPNAWWEPSNSTALMAASVQSPSPFFVEGMERYDPVSVVRQLIEAGADVDVMNDEGKTALDCCLEARGQLWDIDEIIAANARIEEVLREHSGERWEPDRWSQVPKDRRAELLIGYIDKERMDKVREGIERYGAEFTDFELHRALVSAAGESVEYARLILDAGAPVNVDDESGGDYTPIACAVASNNVEMVRLLIGHGANPFVRSGRYNRDAFDVWEAVGGDPVVLDLLKGADASKW